MRKNISGLLQKGNLTPRERYLLLISNDIARETEGKEFLTEADKTALGSWHAKTNEEAREWNKYNEGWKLSGRGALSVEYIYFQTLAEYYRKRVFDTELGFYPFYREHIDDLNQLKKIKPVDIKEAIEITNKQREQKLKDGLDFNDAVYKLAFESLDEDLKKDILTLDERAENDTDYLNDEEIIANLFNGKDELTKEAKEKLAEFISERAINKGLTDCFAELPIFELAKKWAEQKDIKIPKEYTERKTRQGIIKKIADKRKEDEGELIKKVFFEEKLEEILEAYAKDNKTTTKAILKETCLKWFDNGLFIDGEYPLMFNSKQKNTYNGDTKHQHDEIFKEWLKAKDKAKETLKGLINKGELEQTGQDRTVTGESLYKFKGDYKFIKDFKKRVDEYDAKLDGELLICERNDKGEAKFNSIFGRAIDTLEKHFKETHFFKETEKDGEIFLEFKKDVYKEAFKEARESLIKGYAELLAFQETFKKLSKIFEIDVGFSINKRVESVSGFIDDHNLALGNALDETMIDNYKKSLKMGDDLFIDKDKILPDIGTLESWSKKFGDIFTEF